MMMIGKGEGRGKEGRQSENVGKRGGRMKKRQKVVPRAAADFVRLLKIIII